MHNCTYRWCSETIENHLAGSELSNQNHVTYTRYLFIVSNPWKDSKVNLLRGKKSHGFWLPKYIPAVSCVLSRSVMSDLFDPMDCSLPGSSGHGILQARVLEWVAVPSSRGSSQPRDPPQVSGTAGGFFTLWATREALEMGSRVQTLALTLNCWVVTLVKLLHSLSLSFFSLMTF